MEQIKTVYLDYFFFSLNLAAMEKWVKQTMLILKTDILC